MYKYLMENIRVGICLVNHLLPVNNYLSRLEVLCHGTLMHQPTLNHDSPHFPLIIHVLDPPTMYYAERFV